jgi:hypothetical protein
MEDCQHYVADDQLVDIIIAGIDGGKERWRVPEVLFTRNQEERVKGNSDGSKYSVF